MFEAVVSLSLDDGPDPAYRLPASTRSLLFDFDGSQIGAVASSANEFAPGTRHDDVRLEFWAETDARALVRPGSDFTVWYGRTVGRGRVSTVSG